MINNDFNKPSIDIAIDAINQATGHRFTRKDIALKDIQYLDEGYYNSAATIIPNVGSRYYDEVDVKYDRFNLLRLFHGNDVNLPYGNQKTLADYLPIINKRYNLSLDKDDIINGVIPDGVKLPFRMQIQIRDDNPAFIGYIPITFVDNETSLSYILAKANNTFSIEPQYTNDNNDDTNDSEYITGESLLLDYDYSEYSNKLVVFSIGDIVNDTILSLFINHLEEWHNVPYEMPFNLYRSKVLYNGEIDGIKQVYTPINHDFTHVLVLEMNNKYCSNIRGNLIIRYRL